jgi:hypothetical protein
VCTSSSRSSDKYAAQGHAWSLSRRGSVKRTKVRNRNGGTVGDSKYKQAYHPHQHIQRTTVEYRQIRENLENSSCHVMLMVEGGGGLHELWSVYAC